MTRLTMRRLGFRSIPVGPRSATRADEFGLTRREHEVLYVPVGMPGWEIALIAAGAAVVAAALAALAVPAYRFWTARRLAATPCWLIGA